jgi:hypothetical protein
MISQLQLLLNDLPSSSMIWATTNPDPSPLKEPEAPLIEAWILTFSTLLSTTASLSMTTLKGREVPGPEPARNVRSAEEVTKSEANNKGK